MILALIVLVPILFLSVWAFFRFSPEVKTRQGILLFNLSVLVVGMLICVFLTLKVYSSMGDGQDRAWWPVLSALGTLVIFPMVLLLGGLVRNRWIFRPGNPQG